MRWHLLLATTIVAYVLHALYFDWSDWFIHSVITVAILLWSWRSPRAAASCLLFLLVLVVTLHHVLAPQPTWAATAVRGSRWSEVRRELGEPTFEARGLAEASTLVEGYAAPSPLRFQHSGPVAVYIGGEYALWVMHDGERIVNRFVGGS